MKKIYRIVIFLLPLVVRGVPPSFWGIPLFLRGQPLFLWGIPQIVWGYPLKFRGIPQIFKDIPLFEWGQIVYTKKLFELII